MGKNSCVNRGQPSAYDPTYDPLMSPVPGHGQAYAPTYWVDTAGSPPEDDGPITQDIDVDLAIIGSGFTGLSCALFLAEEHGIKAHVLEANQVVWGCTSRNGGQAQNASGRLTRSQWIQRWGKDTALKLHAEIEKGFDTFKHLMQDIDCDAQRDGHLYNAHRPNALEKLRAEVKVHNEVFGYKTRILERKSFSASM